ncbi:AAA family ATPase [Pseudonocardia asaccharolytica]|uniref:Nuclease SbcCD subunit C n=1 Tax=Pseudonocardia asaccharolytica DSM 44247 = NBRC 16224 TaxID=1123024 RepID=A0A511D3T8_9PSEU|nr:AAA family ATPase [Pseudonocardia asaccharolytica]GEL19449.1 hypothetical protein PA7_32860 [Pseudonocardia asaccharolytica DSM 44247 = NBRC 16224]
MILLTRIEVTNIRSITHGVIEPLPDGITALVGVIGTGKSTFLEAVRWALYGEVPGGLRQAEMRRRGADGRRCEAAVDFIVSGTAFRAVRGLRQKTAKGRVIETAYAELFIDGARQPQITPTKLTEKVVGISGLTGRAFSGAFFIPQNRLPTLAQGTPGEIQQVFEEQTGLTPLTRRVEAAHRDAGQAAATAEALPGSAEEVKTAQEALEIARAEERGAQQRFATAKAGADASRRALTAAQAVHGLLTDRRSAAEQARLDAARAETRVAGLAETIRELVEQARDLPAGDGRDARRRLAELRTARQAADHAGHTMESASASVSEARRRLRDARGQLERLPVDLEERLDAARRAQTDAEHRVGRLRGEYTRLNQAVQALRSAGARAARCPTCGQEVAHLAELLTGLAEQAAQCETDGHQAARSAHAAAAQNAELAAALRRQEAARTALRQARDEVRDAVRARRTAAGRARVTLDELATLLQVAGEGARVMAAAEAAEDAAAREVSAVRYAEQLRTRLVRARGDHAAAQAALAELHTRAADVTTVEELDNAAAALAAARADWEADSARCAEAATRAEVLAERCRVLEAARDGEQRLLEAKLDALGRAEILRHAARMLAGLRRDLLAEYTATVSEAATDLLRQIGGEHTAFHIDERFAPEVVLADGTRRPLRMLSGGEQARSALCFCLGISAQITGGSRTGTISADEITAAYDDETRQAIVDLLRDLGWPLLIIAHSPEIVEIANRVVRLGKPDEATGTRVLSGAPDEPTPGELADLLPRPE